MIAATSDFASMVPPGLDPAEAVAELVALGGVMIEAHRLRGGATVVTAWTSARIALVASWAGRSPAARAGLADEPAPPLHTAQLERLALAAVLARAQDGAIETAKMLAACQAALGEPTS